MIVTLSTICGCLLCVLTAMFYKEQKAKELIQTYEELVVTYDKLCAYHQQRYCEMEQRYIDGVKAEAELVNKHFAQFAEIGGKIQQLRSKINSGK